MGAWGHEPFENDSALNFLYDVDEKGADAVMQALDAVLDCTAKHCFTGEEAVAAAVFVAAANGHLHWIPPLTEEPVDFTPADFRRECGWGPPLPEGEISESAHATFMRCKEHERIRQMRDKAVKVLDWVMTGAGNCVLRIEWETAEPVHFNGFMESIARLKADLSHPVDAGS